MEVKIPRYIDDPLQILWFEVDEVVVFALLFVLGMALGQTLAGFGGGVIATWLMVRAKRGRGISLVLHWAYWHGIVDMKPESWREEFYQ